MSFEMEAVEAGLKTVGGKNSKKMLPFIIGAVGLGVITFMMKKNNNVSRETFSNEEQDIGGNVAGLFQDQQQQYTGMLNDLSTNVGQSINEMQQELINSNAELRRIMEENNVRFNQDLLTANQKIEELTNGRTSNTGGGGGTTIIVQDGGNSYSQLPMEGAYIGDKYYEADYINNPANEEEIRNAIVNNKYDDVYVKDVGGNLVSNTTGKVLQKSDK